MDSGPALCVRRSTQQSDGLWFLLSSHSVDNQGPLQIAAAMDCQCHR